MIMIYAEIMQKIAIRLSDSKNSEPCFHIFCFNYIFCFVYYFSQLILFLRQEKVRTIDF